MMPMCEPTCTSKPVVTAGPLALCNPCWDVHVLEGCLACRRCHLCCMYRCMFRLVLAGWPEVKALRVQSQAIYVHTTGCTCACLAHELALHIHVHVASQTNLYLRMYL